PDCPLNPGEGGFFRADGANSNDEVITSKNLIIYPNPIQNNTLHIRYKVEDSSSEYMVMDILGNIVRSGKLNDSNTMDIDFINKDAGMYFIFIKNGKGEITSHSSFIHN
ncbi:MAG TPA: T9SS type A sorting domain-containing protein, partial [Phaeodactylibacter sp.]|nr:T9SS type A sorting domain-containing protein [Phaeodactylibacter sp.]